MQGDCEVDYLEAGDSGPWVLLVHSSVSGARQWRRLMDDLVPDFRVRAVNLYGYGKTPAWPDGGATQTLRDQARLVLAALPPGDDSVSLVGHSFGGSVAMQAAADLGGRVDRLVLLEPNPFYLLDQAHRHEAFAEAVALRDCIKTYGARGEWSVAAERFADYWNGAGSWLAMSHDRRVTFAEALRPNFHEWDAVIAGTTPLEGWANSLPASTMVVVDPATVAPTRGIAELLRAACPLWSVAELPGAGHMAPLTAPDRVNPVVREFLLGQRAS